MVEFALGIGLLWLIFAAVYTFGYSFYIYNKLETAASDAALYGSRLTYDTGRPSVCPSCSAGNRTDRSGLDGIEREHQRKPRGWDAHRRHDHDSELHNWGAVPKVHLEE